MTNLASLRAGIIKFEEIMGRSEDKSMARRGETPRVIGRGRYLFDGRNAYCELLYDEDDFRSLTSVVALPGSSKRATSVISLVNPFRALTDGERTLYEVFSIVPGSKTVGRRTQVIMGTEKFWQDARPILDVGNPHPEWKDYNLYNDLVGALSGTSGKTLIGIKRGELIDGRTTTHIKVGMPLGRRSYWVDESRGCVPLRIEDVLANSNEATMIYLDDIQGVNRSGWLPFKRTVVEVDGRFRQYRIITADFDRRPKPEEFTLLFDEPQPMADPAAKRTLARKRQWGLSDLAAMARSSHDHGQRLRKEDDLLALRSSRPKGVPAEMPGEREPGLFRLLSVGSAVVFAAVAIGVVTCVEILRRRRTGSREHKE